MGPKFLRSILMFVALMMLVAALVGCAATRQPNRLNKNRPKKKPLPRLKNRPKKKPLPRLKKKPLPRLNLAKL